MNMCMSKVQHIMGRKTGCNQSRLVFFSFFFFLFFDKPCNWQLKIFRICATATSGPVFCSWVQFNFGLFSVQQTGPVNTSWSCNVDSIPLACWSIWKRVGARVSALERASCKENLWKISETGVPGAGLKCWERVSHSDDTSCLAMLIAQSFATDGCWSCMRSKRLCPWKISRFDTWDNQTGWHIVSSSHKKSCMEGKRGCRRLHACSTWSVTCPASILASSAAAASSSFSFITLIGACWAYDSHMFTYVSHYITYQMSSRAWQSLIKHEPARAVRISTISLYLHTGRSPYKCPMAACLSVATRLQR